MFGAREAAWPKIRDDLGLTYLQVGLILSVPLVVSNLIEPVLGILGDVWRRPVLIICGGFLFSISALLVSASRDFGHLLLAFIVFAPAAGAFVSLSQATLMDREPAHRERSMSLWTVAGYVGVLTGTAAIGVSIAVGFGWRNVFLGSGVLAGVAVLLAARNRSQLGGRAHSGDVGVWQRLRASVRGVLNDLRRLQVVRWLVLLELSDLMLDILLGYLALYLVDVGRATPAQAAVGVGVWMAAGLVGNLGLVPLLDRVSGVSVLRVSAIGALVLFPVMLVVPHLWTKLMLLAVLGAMKAGWYPILQARLYDELPGRSGSAITLKKVSGLGGNLLPLAIGAAAAAWGLGTAMWFMLAAPMAIVVGLWRVDAGGGRH